MYFKYCISNTFYIDIYIKVFEIRTSTGSRSILDNVHLIRNIIDYCNQKNVPCILLDLDQEKAFDRVNHKFLAKALARFGFKHNFIEWVKILYTNVSSCVLVNNFVSSSLE